MPDIERSSDDLIEVTMARPAAKRTVQALIRAAGWADEKGKDEDYDWLMWAAGRIAQAMPTTPEGATADAR
jgi:hypothetical protein